MSWGKILLLAAVGFGVIVVVSSTFYTGTVSLGTPTFGPLSKADPNASGAGAP